MTVGTRDLQNILARINSKLVRTHAPLLRLRSGYGKCGVDRADNSNLSPLLPRTGLYAYLNAFEDGLDYASNAATKQQTT